MLNADGWVHSDGLVILLGTYLCWAGGSFVILYSDLQRQPRGEWGPLSWGTACAVGGGLVLPLYFVATRGTPSALLRGILLGILIGVLTFVARIGLSLLLQVPVV
jgi:hypothetical protein